MKPLEEIQATLTEKIFEHRQVLLEGYHRVGEIILEHNLNLGLVSQVTGQRPKTLHYCVELVKKYPDLSNLPEGKNVSWYKITKTLPPYEKNATKEKK